MKESTRSRDWRLLVISLTGRRGTARMRVWRALKTAGAAVLRDGVYLLPDVPAARSVFDEQARAVRTAGGTAQVLALAATDEQASEFLVLFDRSKEYASLLDAVHKLQVQLRRRRATGAERRLQVLRRSLEALQLTDYFPGPAAEQTREALNEMEAMLLAQTAPDEPQAHNGAIEKRDPRRYRGCTWATRARPWVDRLASAWLIRRFIDPKAKILWLKDIKRCPKTALGFDFDGATFSHVGTRVTFEHLLASFGLEEDPALMRVGRLVHCLDVGGVPVAEAQGLSAVLAGAREHLAHDDKLLAEASRIFDHLYLSYQKE